MIAQSKRDAILDELVGRYFLRSPLPRFITVNDAEQPTEAFLRSFKGDRRPASGRLAGVLESAMEKPMVGEAAQSLAGRATYA